MFRYDEESQFLDEDVPRIAHNIGALILMLLCAAVGLAFLAFIV